jgi:pSer/pThr/pTyr-binding forkhead associated (FHA) protein
MADLGAAMPERIFTIFAGPDKGRKFVLGDKPIEIGREQGRDLMLHDDRASRLHARLEVADGQVVIFDCDSANGILVNGVLVDQSNIQSDDILTIASTEIIYADSMPTEDRLLRHSAMRVAHSMRAQDIGDVTQVLPESLRLSGLNKELLRPLDMLEAVADSVQSKADALGMHVTVETETEDEGGTYVMIDSALLQATVASLADMLLDCMPPNEGTLALRYGRDVSKGGGRIDLMSICAPVPTDAIRKLEGTGAFDSIHEEVAKNSGLLRLLPEDTHGVLARLHLPGPNERATQNTIIQT